jgi:sec-independent protein translocase protein TatA
MNFGNMGFMEILLILVVVLLLFGAKRIPEIAQSMGKGIREFKKSVSDVDRAVREPERDARLDREYGTDRLQNSAREAQPRKSDRSPSGCSAKGAGKRETGNGKPSGRLARIERHPEGLPFPVSRFPCPSVVR